MSELPSEERILEMFKHACQKLDIDDPEDNMKKTVIYLMTDGTRTATSLDGKEAYIDGSDFSKRFVHAVKTVGGRACYVNVFEEFHQKREDYENIYSALIDVVPDWKDFVVRNDIRLKFVGDFESSFGPGKDLRKYLRALEDLTKKNEFTAYILINFSREWALANKEFFKDMPTINSVIRFTKGQGIPESMLPPGKVEHESLVYVQQGSSSINWSDRQIVFLIALALRANVRNMPYFLQSSYVEGDRERIRRQREEERIFIDENFYDGKEDEGEKPKVAVIFSEVGPERYTF
ncbi:MAG: hypothetical protein QMD36_04395 [Candidatus Aenigmarchaeota archaeon]|nr:hypothetical protein [Candidatus Aenigmarchaeota archaeon]